MENKENMTKCSDVVEFEAEDTALEDYLEQLSAKELLYIDKWKDGKPLFTKWDYFIQPSADRIVREIKDFEMTPRYIYQPKHSLNRNENLTPAGKSDIVSRHVIILMEDGKIKVLLEPEIENPDIMPKDEEASLNENSATDKLLNEFSEEVKEKAIEKLDNMGLNILNSCFNEDEIQTIFRNLANSTFAQTVKMMTPELYKAIAGLSEMSAGDVARHEYISALDTEIKEKEKELSELDTKIDTLNSIYKEMLENYKEMSEKIKEISSEDFMKNAVESIKNSEYLTQMIDEKVQISVEDAIEEQEIIDDEE